MIAAALAAAAGCGKGDERARPGEGAASPPRDPLLDVALPAGATRVDGNQFHVDVVAQPGCTAGTTCAVLADVTSLGDFKVNPEYPHKFVPAAGSTPAPAATFTLTGVHRARLIVRLPRPSDAPLRVAGDLKLSVCNPDRCLIEVAPIAVAID